MLPRYRLAGERGGCAGADWNAGERCEDADDDVTARPRFAEWVGGCDAFVSLHTNAGGGLLNAILGRAQRACCAEVAEAMDAVPGEALADAQAMHVGQRIERRGARAGAAIGQHGLGQRDRVGEPPHRLSLRPALLVGAALLRTDQPRHQPDLPLRGVGLVAELPHPLQRRVVDVALQQRDEDLCPRRRAR